MVLAGMALMLLHAGASGQQVRKYTNEYMRIGAGARGMALGNAAVTLSNDVSAAWYNPSALSQMEGTLGLHFTHAEYFGGVLGYDFGGIALKAGKRGHFGLSFLRLGADNIPNTFNLIDGDGQVNPDAVTGFSAADYGFFATYAHSQKLKKKDESKLSYGGNLKVLHRKVGPFATAWGMGLDLSALYQKGDFRLGVDARDLTTTVTAWSFTWTEEQKQILLTTGNAVPLRSSELMLPTIAIGASNTFDVGSESSFAIEGGLTIEAAQQTNRLLRTKALSATPQLGAEFGIKKTVYVRAGLGDFGYYTPIEKDKQSVSFKPSIGAGLKLGGKLSIDYALSDFAQTGAGLLSHVVGLSYAIDQP